MNKKIQLLATLGLAISFVTACSSFSSRASAEDNGTCIVDFYNNYLRQEFTLSNGFAGKGNNLLYKTALVSVNSVVAKPEDPTRRNYEFKGWYKEEQCENEWNFETDKVTSNLRLFAKWGISEKSEDAEPPYTPPSTVLPADNANDYVVSSVMYFPVTSNEVKVTTPALLKLEASKTNVLPLMEYKVKAGLNITATYNEKVITITCNGVTNTINVKDDSASYIVGNATYENKAKNYEAKAVEEESYHVMLAGSSSIEFWTSSAEDLDPIVSYNHGIGGTTIEEWDEKLNQRLVFPYKPKMVVYYVGINNVINTDQDASTIWGHLNKFLDDTHAALPDTKVQYIMMNLIPGYPAKYDTINFVNNKVTEYQQSHQWLTLINPGVALLKENGEPNAAYFRTDGLHLSYYGYVVWGGIIKESIINGLKEQ